MIKRQALRSIPRGDSALKITPGIKDVAHSAVTPWITHTTTVMAARAVPACASMVCTVAQGTEAMALFKLAIEVENAATAVVALADTTVEVFKAAVVTCCRGDMVLRHTEKREGGQVTMGLGTQGALGNPETGEHRLEGEATCAANVAAVVARAVKVFEAASS